MPKAASNSGTPKRPKPGLLHNLGAFVGHVVQGVRTPASPPVRVIREEVLERSVTLPEGKLILRRTVRDEVVPAPPGHRVPPNAS